MSDVARGALDGATLDHVGVVVPVLEEAIEFFTTVLGFDLAFQMDPLDDPTGAASGRLGATEGRGFALAMLTLGSGRLELLQWWPAPDPASPAPDAVGSHHVAIEVDDVEAAVERLSSTPGVQVVSQPMSFPAGQTPGLTNAFITSPWGCLIELLHWTAR